MKAFARLGVALFVLILAAPEAEAHTKSESQSVWRPVGSTVHVGFSIPDIEAKRLSKTGNDVPSDDELAKYVDSREVVLDDGKVCEKTQAARPVAAAANFHRFEMSFRCPDNKALAFQSNAFFDIVATHLTYAQIVSEDGNLIEQIFTKGAQTLELSAASGSSPLQNASFFTYIGMGIMHIFTGYDHQAFLLALVLLSRKLRDLLFVITGFTIGHSISLSMSVLGILRPHAEFIDSLVGLTIALVAAENIAHSSGRSGTIALLFGGLLLMFAGAHFLGLGPLPLLIVVGAAIFAMSYMMMSGHIRDAARLRLIVTLVFGTIHGFSFASNLLEMRLPAGRLAQLLVGFNVGVEVGQVSVVLLILGFVWLLTRLNWTLPRAIVTDVLSGGLVGMGLFWFVTRGYSITL